ncbi:MAG: hypothetical protein RRZ65_07695 [Tannerellaceae bacterium]
MKKIVCKMIPIIGIVLFSAGILSCSSDNGVEDLPIHTVAVPIKIGNHLESTNKNATEKILAKLKDLRYIGIYSKAPYLAFPVDFRQENVKQADKEKVLADLTAQAHTHYAAAVEKVNKYDFNSLVSDEFAAARVMLDISIENKSYDIDVQIQKPLIWDKAWITNVVDCPIQEINFEGTTNVLATLHMQGGSATKSVDVSRSSDNTIVIETSDSSYAFKLLSATQMQLIQIRFLSTSKITDVATKNYVFNHKK